MSPWFLNATQRGDGWWVVRWAGVHLEPVPTEPAVVDLLAALATALGGRDMFDLRLHHRDGKITRMAASEARPRYLTAASRRLWGRSQARPNASR